MGNQNGSGGASSSSAAAPAAAAQADVPMVIPSGSHKRSKKRVAEDPPDDPRLDTGSLGLALFHLGLASDDSVDLDNLTVSEIFCKDRYSSRAHEFRLHPGFACDLSTGWDLNNPAEAEAALAKVDSDEPALLVTTPICTPFSAMMRWCGIDPAKLEENLKEGRRHLSISMAACKKQHLAKRFFLHEHPDGASSWDEDPVQEMLGMDGVFYVKNDQCAAGQTEQGPNSKTAPLVRKTTGWMTNSERIARRLKAFVCPNRQKDDPSAWHVHGSLKDGRSRNAQEHPGPIVEAVLQGLVEELQARERLHLEAVEVGYNVDEADPLGFDMPVEAFERYYDEVTGALLDPKLVREARREEVQWVKDFKVYEKVPEAQSKGKPFIDMRWMDLNKGDEAHPLYRSRLVGRELRKRNPGMEGTFAATPPLEAFKYLLSSLMTVRRRGPLRRRAKRKMLVLDVSRAHFHAPAVREVYVKLPEEDRLEGHVGRLLRTMYGTRDAAAQWEAYYADKFESAEFSQGLFSPCLFRHEARDLEALVHGDDMGIVGEEEDLLWIEAELGRSMVLKRRALLGPDSTDDKQVTFLNRIVTYGRTAAGVDRVEWEADPRHVDTLLREQSLDGQGAKAVSTPGVKDVKFLDASPLEGAAATAFRSQCMRLGFLAQDCPHLQFQSKELARHMSTPTRGAVHRLKRVCRFLKGYPRPVQEFVMQEPVAQLTVYTDSDWAGDEVERKSTSAVYLFHGRHLLRSSSSTQAVVATSVGEAEFYAFVRGCSIGLGAVSMAKDLGQSMRLVVRTDSSAAKGIASRRGVGKVRHLHTPCLWVQQRVFRRDLAVEKVAGPLNVADLGTKPLAAAEMHTFLARCGISFKEGRHGLALRAAEA